MMNRSVFFVCAALACGLAAAAPGQTGAGKATLYNVDVREVKLCQDGACASGYVVGSGSKTFDIASASAGSDVGSYANTDAIPQGTYTHIRVVLSRTFTVAGGPCLGQTTTSVSRSIPNGTDPVGMSDALAGGGSITWFDSNKTLVSILDQLPTPITISKGNTTPPVAKVKFNTSNALGCVDTGPGGIIFFPAEPAVTISLQ